MHGWAGREARDQAQGRPEERDPRDRQWQAALTEVGSALKAGGLSVSQRGMAFDSVDVMGYPLPVFMAAAAPYAHDLATMLTTVLKAWIDGRPGRGFELHEGDFHLKVDDVSDLPRVEAFVAALRHAREG